jgi:hypothetical protein
LKQIFEKTQPISGILCRSHIPGKRKNGVTQQPNVMRYVRYFLLTFQRRHKYIGGVRPETGKFVRDQGARKILPQAQGCYPEDKIFHATPISGQLVISGWAIGIIVPI